jgi:3-deoxy-D-manno-octulosonic-acid transferase
VPEVAELGRRRGFEVVRRTELPRAHGAGAVIVVDTVGELASMYSAGDVAFVGGSLVPAGGHNVLEPALRAKPVLFGPHTENFREAAGLLRDGGGAVVRDGVELATTLTRWMTDGDLRASLGSAARQAAASREGAVRETLELIRRFLLTPVAS